MKKNKRYEEYFTKQTMEKNANNSAEFKEFQLSLRFTSYVGQSTILDPIQYPTNALTLILCFHDAMKCYQLRTRKTYIE